MTTAEPLVVLPYPPCKCGHRYDHHQDPGDPRRGGCYACACTLYDPDVAEIHADLSAARHDRARQLAGLAPPAEPDPPPLRLVPPVALVEWMNAMPDEGIELVPTEEAERGEAMRDAGLDAAGAGLPGPDLSQVIDHLVERQRWKITGERGAVWAMRKLADATAEKAEHEATHSGEIARLEAWFADARAPLDAWLDDVSRPLEGSIEHFTFLLDEYHRGIVDEELAAVDTRGTLYGPVPKQSWEKGVKHKTLKLPNGEVTARRATGRLVVDDEEAAIEYLREHAPELLKWKTSIAATELKDGGAKWNDEARCYEFPIRCMSEQMLGLATEKYPSARVEHDNPLPEGEEFAATMWVPIPGVRLDGAGVVSFTPKPE